MKILSTFPLQSLKIVNSYGPFEDVSFNIERPKPIKNPNNYPA